MSKKVIEFSVGDPKSNQQTASKLDCQIIVNNNTERSKSGTRSEVVDDVQIYESSSEGVGIEASQDVHHKGPQRPKEDVLKVNVPVKRSVDVKPDSANRFYVTSRNPAVMKEEIFCNDAVKDERIRILMNIVCNDDKHLLANLLDRSGKVILSANDFASLVAIMLSSGGNEISTADVKLSYRDEYITSCLSVKLSPYKSITNIIIGDQDMRIHQYEAYNVLVNDFGISGELVYYPE